MIEKEWLSQYSPLSMHQQMKKTIFESVRNWSESVSSNANVFLERAVSINTMEQTMLNLQEYFNEALKLDFDLFKFSDRIGRQ